MEVTEKDYFILWENRENTEEKNRSRSNMSWLGAPKQCLTEQ